LQKTLFLGYGNPDRQDDGIAWHVLAAVARLLEYPVPFSWEEGFQPSPSHPDLEFIFSLQLVPEMAEQVSMFERVCFVDAHTGRIPEDIQIEDVTAEMQNSPFTHHLTPATLLFLSKSLYSAQPQAVLLSVRGYEFGFSHSLSDSTFALLTPAINQIMIWFNKR
jgi:hydrogenase maturation protease